MKKKSNQCFLVFWLVFTFILGACNDRREESLTITKQYFLFDPTSILDEISQGKADVFTAIETMQLPTPNPSPTVFWTQEEFIRLAQEIHQQVWGEPMDVNNLDTVSFRVNCSDVEKNGFNSVSIHLFQTGQRNGEKSRLEYDIFIKLSTNSVGVLKTEFIPYIWTLEPINLAEFKISAESALEIAERKGGTDFRKNIGNQCEVFVTTPGASGKGWYVHYDSPQPKVNFKVSIDSQTETPGIIK